MPQLFLDAVDDALLFERMESFGGGMDGFTRSTLLPPDASQYLENCIVEQNFEARTRPGADALGGGAVAGSPSSLQGLAYFDKPATQRLLTAMGGNFYAFDGTSWSAAAGWTIDPGGTFTAAQGVDKLLLSDSITNLQIWDGAAFSAVLNGPTGASILCWASGRMFAAGFGGTVGGKETDAIWPSQLLQFDSSGWRPTDSFRVGAGDGDPIRAMAPLPVTSAQSYLLAVLKANSTWLVNADPTQTPVDWSVLLVGPGVGCVGRYALCQFGNDLLFMSRDGVRSVRRMEQAAGQYELSAPISQPMQPYIDRINWAYASGITATRYKELALFAVPLDNSLTNNTVLVFNGRLQRWVGVWTGWTPVAFAVSRFATVQALNVADTSGRVNQWKDTAPKDASTTYQENGSWFPTRVWTRSATFQDLINPKDGYHSEVRFTNGNAVVNVTAVADNAETRSWQATLAPIGPVLPVALPFVLGTPNPVTCRRSLRGLSEFNELYLKLETAQGWFSCRNITLTAFLNMLADSGSGNSSGDKATLSFQTIQ